MGQFPVYCIGTKFTLMSTHRGSRFAWLVQCTLEGGGEGKGRGGEERGGEGEKVRNTVSSAMHIGGKELCVTFLKVVTRWLFVDACC